MNLLGRRALLQELSERQYKCILSMLTEIISNSTTICKKVKKLPTSIIRIFKNGNWNLAGKHEIFLDGLLSSVTPLMFRHHTYPPIRTLQDSDQCSACLKASSWDKHQCPKQNSNQHSHQPGRDLRHRPHGHRDRHKHDLHRSLKVLATCTLLTHWRRGHLNCLNARSRGF